MAAISLKAHFDGQHIQLDEPDIVSAAILRVVDAADRHQAGGGAADAVVGSER